jgi:hypothetical protein
MSSLSDTMEHQNDRIHKLEKTIEDQKVAARSTNLIIYGVSGTPGGWGRPPIVGGRDLQWLIPNIVETYRLGHLKANVRGRGQSSVKFNTLERGMRHSRSVGAYEGVLSPLRTSRQSNKRPAVASFHSSRHSRLKATLSYGEGETSLPPSRWENPPMDPGAPPPAPPPAGHCQGPPASQARPTSQGRHAPCLLCNLPRANLMECQKQ